MKLEFIIDAPPFSINNAYYRNRQRNQKCRQWGDNILPQLEKLDKKFTKFREYVNKRINTHSLDIEIIFYYPKEKLLTKTGKVSRNSMDLSNVEKLLIDLIYDKKYYERGNLNLNLDDCLNTGLTSKKRVSPNGKYHIHVKIQTLKNSTL